MTLDLNNKLKKRYRPMSKMFCKKYVDDVFSKWDTDNSNVLNKQ